MRKHARPHSIVVRVFEEGEMLCVDVADDGCGFDFDAVRTRPEAPLHFGLDTMVERIRAAGGDAVIESAIGRGTTVRMRVPILVPELPAVRAEL